MNGWKIYFIYANAYGIGSSLVYFVFQILFRKRPDICEEYTMYYTSFSDIHVAAEILFTIYAALTFGQGIVAVLWKKYEKGLLNVYIFSVAVILVAQLGLCIAREVYFANIDKGEYTECFKEAAKNFDETDTKSDMAKYLVDRRECCSVDGGDLETFWAGITWSPSSLRDNVTGNMYKDIPVQCCKAYGEDAKVDDNYFKQTAISKCLNGDKSQQLTKGCWELKVESLSPNLVNITHRVMNLLLVVYLAIQAWFFLRHLEPKPALENQTGQGNQPQFKDQPQPGGQPQPEYQPHPGYQPLQIQG